MNSLSKTIVILPLLPVKRSLYFFNRAANETKTNPRASMTNEHLRYFSDTVISTTPVTVVPSPKLRHVKLAIFLALLNFIYLNNHGYR